MTEAMGTTDRLSSCKKDEAVVGPSSILDSFSKFNVDEMPSILPPKPDTGNDEEGDEKTIDSSYIYPVDTFPSKSAFEISTEFPALILPVRRTHELRKKLKSIMLSRPRLPVVVELSDSDIEENKGGHDVVENEAPDNKSLKLTQENRKMYRKLVLDSEKAGLTTDKGDNADASESTTKMNAGLKALLEKEPESFRLGSHTIVLSYQDWTAEEILGRLLLPEGVKEIPSAFEAVGHLAHVNLRDEVLPFKYLIGKVLLDKNSPRIRTVVNKLGSIDNKYRTFGMEVIAGDDKSNDGEDSDSWSNVLVKEEGCEYRLDFRKVYWNSRLGGEHRRLVKLIRKDASERAQNEQAEHDTSSGDLTVKPQKSLIVADLMAGIGPFAIPLTARTKESNHSKRGDKGNTKKNKKKNQNKSNAINRTPPLPIKVYANDLNPSSYKYLIENAKRNKCDFTSNEDSLDPNDKQNEHKLYAYNMDARAFCHQLQNEGIRPDHVIMNLPATALEFLDAFRGYPRSGGNNHDEDLPRIHVHCFAPKDLQVAQQDIWKRVETALGCSLHEKNDKVVIHPVRDVAPNKNMYCISFRLPSATTAMSRIQVDIDHPDKEKQSQTSDSNNEVEEPDCKRRKTDK